MAETLVDMLRGERNDLGRTEEVVTLVLNSPERMGELYQCFFQEDEWVRMRAASSFKRIWRADVELFLPHLDGFVREISAIDQPSVQWTFAELCTDLDDHLTGMQRRSAKSRIKRYLTTSTDWIVLNRSIETLAHWSATDARLATWLKPELAELASDPRKSVATRAQKALVLLPS